MRVITGVMDIGADELLDLLFSSVTVWQGLIYRASNGQAMTFALPLFALLNFLKNVFYVLWC